MCTQEVVVAKKRIKQQEEEIKRTSPTVPSDIDQERAWLDSQIEEVMKKREAQLLLDRDLQQREEKLSARETALAEKTKLELRKLRASQV